MNADRADERGFGLRQARFALRKRLIAAAVWVTLAAGPAWGQIVRQARAAAGAGEFARGEQLIAEYRQARGVTAEMILALSWLGRGAQAAKDWDRAERYAQQTRELALAELQKRALDADEELPLALGASIEVQAHTLAARGARSQAVAFLRQELERWRETSMRARIQKNLHLLSLTGQPAPPLETREYLGAKPATLAELKGQAVLLFFWAHWCSDCKQQAPVLERLQQEYGPRGLVLVGPTRRYGYVARGADASPEEELRYIAEMRQNFYGALRMAVPVSEENFDAWGCSTTPTLALLDRAGKVQLYHPGRMSYEQLAPLVAEAVEGRPK
jgi:cytochrome c biogenesis protein CcmG/thiol:disulfide interchange protein DsbE